MNSMPSRLRLLPAISSLLLLWSCGGGGDGGASVVDAAACQAITDTGSVVVGSGLPGDPAAPEPASGYRLGKTVVYAKTYMVVTANPYASKAGCDILKAGGNAADAAVAVQAVLGLVEPQSSGLGGGAFMLHYDAATKAVDSLRRPRDGAGRGDRELPALDRRRHRPATPMPSARASGRSIGTPGVMRMLDLAHQDARQAAVEGRCSSRRSSWPPTASRSARRMAAAIEGSRTSLMARRRSEGVLPERRRQRQGARHDAEEPGAMPTR